MQQLVYSSDKPSPFAHPGIRAAYTFTSWAVLGMTISPGNSLFVGLLILYWGLLFDYLRFNPITEGRKRVKGIGIFKTSVFIIINFCASYGATVSDINDSPHPTDTTHLYMWINNFPFLSGIHFSVYWFWLASVISVLYTFVDWGAEKRELEKILTGSKQLTENIDSKQQAAPTVQVES